jgi:hypothetical protein
MDPRRMGGIFLPVLLLLAALPPAPALEVGAESGAVVFQPHREADPAAAGLAEGSFFDNLRLVGNLRLETDLTDLLEFDVRLEHDPILLNRFITRLGFHNEYFSLNAGPFFGVFNSAAQPVDPGLSLGLNIRIPGIAFGSIMADTTIGDGVMAAGAYIQRSARIEAGFWVPNVIVTLAFESRTFIESLGYTTLTSEWLRYNLSSDMYKKNVPYTVLANVGYQELNWFAGSTREGYTFRSLYVGMELSVQPRPFLRFSLGAETPIYSWVSRNFSSPNPFDALFLLESRLGLVWTLN